MSRSPISVVYIVVLAASFFTALGCATELRINEIQFVGSHNSFKQAMSPEHMRALRAQNPAAARALDYAHLPLSIQLDLGMRKLEIDVFFSPQSRSLVVGHVQTIDMNSNCDALAECFRQVRSWSNAHPRHVPIWISFNAKDQRIEGLPDPAPFTEDAFALFDEVIEAELGSRLIRPNDIVNLVWPKLNDARGKILLILDEQGNKRDLYWKNWRARPMFTNAPPEHPAAAIMILNDPIEQQEEIKKFVRAGYMVRTRADADTREAREGSTVRREAAFESGAQAVSTDYYVEDERFGSGYVVGIAGYVRCNPVTTQVVCSVAE